MAERLGYRLLQLDPGPPNRRFYDHRGLFLEWLEEMAQEERQREALLELCDRARG